MSTHSPRLSIIGFASLAGLALIACSAPSTDAGAPAAKAQGAAGSQQDAADVKAPDAKAPDASGTEANAPQGSSADTAKPDAVAAKQAAAKAKFSAADEATIQANKAKMLTTLNEGRKLVKDGELEAGISKYRELLALDPQYGPALGELGWAEFKAGRLDEAEAHTRHAIARASEDKRRGMLHYNLGRIAEERGETEAAIEAYALSLAFRPNEVVASRLAAIGTVVDAEGNQYRHPAVDAYEAQHGAGAPPSLVGLKLLGSGLSSLQAACEAAVGSCDLGECDLGYAEASQGGAVMLGDGWMMGCWHPVIKQADGWAVFSMALFGQQGSEVDQSVDALTTRVIDNPAGSFLILDYSDHLYERDWSMGELEEMDEIPEQDMTETEGVIICRLGAPALCTTPIPTKYSTSGPGRSSSYSARVTLDGDVVVVSEVAIEGGLVVGARGGEWDPWMPLPEGRYPLAALN